MHLPIPRARPSSPRRRSWPRLFLTARCRCRGAGPARSYGGWRDDSRQDPALLALLGEQNRWTEQLLAAQRPLEQALQAEWQAQTRGESMPQEWLREAGSQWRMEADGRLWQRGGGEQAEPANGWRPASRPAATTSSPAGPAPERALAGPGRDLQGDRDYRITLLDLADGKPLATLTHRASDLLWSLDGKTLYTIANEPRTLRPWQLWAWRDGRSSRSTRRRTLPGC